MLYLCGMSSETLKLEPVRFTKGAIEELIRIRESLQVKDQKLRVGVKGGGCSGLSYLLAFDQPGEKDEHYLIQDMEVIMEKAHVMYVLGMEIDYQQGLNSRGFTFSNPNAKTTCGCGTSFAA